jgi:hypothetical protein
MPILDLDATTAYEHLEGAAHSRWIQVTAADAGTPVGGDCYRPALRRTFTLADRAAGYVLGPCFAQEIQFALGKRDTPLRSSILDAPERAWFVQNGARGANYWPLHFFHRFHPASMLQELVHLLDDSPRLRDGALVYQRPDGRYSDYHYDWRFDLPTPADCIARRAFVRERVNALVDVDFAILVLGLTEAWFDLEADLYLNTAPRPEIVAQNPGRFRFGVLSESDVEAAIRNSLDLLYGRHPSLKIALMVSPIPLLATFSGVDITIANACSKATLVAAARRVVESYRDVFYFPSYEMTMHSDVAAVWSPDRRHVRGEFIERMMDYFTAEVFVGP